MGQAGPHAYEGVTHYGTAYYQAYEGHVGPTGYAYRVTTGHHAGPLGAFIGYKSGFATASIPGSSTTTSYARELHIDMMTHGLGVTASYSTENATANNINHTYGGFAAGAFAQMTLGEGLYFNVGLSRVFGGVSTDPTDGSMNGPSADAAAWRASGRLMLAADWLGLAIELRSTSSERAMLGTVDVTWSSISMMFEAMYITF